MACLRWRALNRHMPKGEAMTDTPTTAPGLEEQIAYVRFLADNGNLLHAWYRPNALAILASLERLRDIEQSAVEPLIKPWMAECPVAAAPHRAPSQPAEAPRV